jgi:hypothetical protein
LPAQEVKAGRAETKGARDEQKRPTPVAREALQERLTVKDTLPMVFELHPDSSFVSSAAGISLQPLAF